MLQTYSNLTFSYREHAVGLGYHYLITNGGTSHTAFKTWNAFKYWLEITGLTFDEANKEQNFARINGSYSVESELLDNQEFFAKFGGIKPYYALCNGSYSIGFIETTESGNVLHVQNPNTDRFLLEHRQVQEHLDTGKPVRFCYAYAH
jgi:hypothetical protein